MLHHSVRSRNIRKIQVGGTFDPTVEVKVCPKATAVSIMNDNIMVCQSTTSMSPCLPLQYFCKIDLPTALVSTNEHAQSSTTGSFGRAMSAGSPRYYLQRGAKAATGLGLAFNGIPDHEVSLWIWETACGQESSNMKSKCRPL